MLPLLASPPYHPLPPTPSPLPPTPPSPPQSSFVIGIVLGLVSFFSAKALKSKLRVDDALEVSCVHGLTGEVVASPAPSSLPCTTPCAALCQQRAHLHTLAHPCMQLRGGAPSATSTCSHCAEPLECVCVCVCPCVRVCVCPGAVGALAIGVAADRRVNSGLTHEGLIRGGDAHLLAYQAAGVVFAVAYTAVATWLILAVLRLVFGPLRCTAEQERQGLDWVDHGDVAYHLRAIEVGARAHHAAPQCHEDSLHGEGEGEGSGLNVPLMAALVGM